MTGERRAWIQSALRLLRSAAPIAVATVVETDGSGPFDVGATMFVDDTGAIEGSVSGGCVDGAVVAQATAVLAGEAPRVVVYGVTDELAGSVGLTCGGTIQVLVRRLTPAARAAHVAVLDAALGGQSAALATVVDGPGAGEELAVIDGARVGEFQATTLTAHAAADAAALARRGVTTTLRYGTDGERGGVAVRVHIRAHVPSPRMLIFGANDFSAALVPFAVQAGYAVTVADARPAFLGAARFTADAEVAIGWPQDVLATVSLGPADAVLVMTHDAKFDEPALLGALQTPAGYIGALGSRRTTAARELRLRDSGATAAELERIHAPCGLDIGASTPAETALSILAEIVAVRAGRNGTPLHRSAGSIRPRQDAMQQVAAPSTD